MPANASPENPNLLARCNSTSVSKTSEIDKCHKVLGTCQDPCLLEPKIGCVELLSQTSERSSSIVFFTKELENITK
jgi:hypothetical protein